MSARTCTLLLVLLASIAGGAHADEGHGHDHGAEAAPRSANGPQRLPDGAVFVPKPAQRQMAVRTVVVRREALPRVLELAGTVVMDPNAGGKVQPLTAGRIEPGPRGLPAPGQRVRKGEVLAYVAPAVAPIERSNQAAQLAELEASRDLARRRLARLEQLADTVPRKEIEAAQSEIRSLGGRIAALGRGLSAREALVAPVSGAIASSHVVAGQVVDARELVFEIVDPQRLRIEALAYDPQAAGDVGAAYLAVAGERVPLGFVGAARSLRGQALPLSFSAEGAELARLAVGQPVRVYVHTRSTSEGFAVPAAVLVRNPSNQSIVWVKAEPERFEPRVVSVEPYDGTQVNVVAGLRAGERVVSRGAGLLNQIR